MHTILFVDDLKPMRDQFSYDIRRKTGYEVVTAANGREALEILADQEIDAVILDLEMPVMDGLEMLERKQKMDLDDVPVIVYTGKGDFEKCVRAIKLGAYNFYDKEEVNIDQMVQSVKNALEQRQLKLENTRLRRASGQDSSIIGESRAIEELRKQIRKMAKVPSNILITGESGSGKELVAREIHRLSPRANQPFVALNCAALPENLVESELFGFEKGAFSGAIRTTKGKFEAANEGMLFLDEIGDMPLTTQAKLLRVLEEKKVSRIGAEGRVIKFDVRLLAATHRNLEAEVEKGNFRQDLYYRICTHVIRVPALRERLEDVKPLALHFIQRICEQFGLHPKTISAEALSILQKYPWQKNNVRELQNIVERLIIECEGDEIQPQHIPSDIYRNRLLAHQPESDQGKTFQEMKQDAERSILLQYLQKNNWHISKTAEELGIANHSNLLKIMRRLNLKRPDRDI